MTCRRASLATFAIAFLMFVLPAALSAAELQPNELDLKAEGIGELQRPALKRLLGEGVSDAVL